MRLVIFHGVEMLLEGLVGHGLHQQVGVLEFVPDYILEIREVISVFVHDGLVAWTREVAAAKEFVQLIIVASCRVL